MGFENAESVRQSPHGDSYWKTGNHFYRCLQRIDKSENIVAAFILLLLFMFFLSTYIM